jgi:4-hydroxy-tetrahydrodipicolinate synthase|tara:strand:- start:8 stop:889 length:882 start_codon:yes stop_codon:yes gene_type:complete
MKELSGICVPVCTTFDNTGNNLDETAFLKHIDAMIEAGVHIIMVCGGTGEFAYLSTEEKRRLIEVSARHVEGRAAFVAQTSAISTRDTIEASKHAADQGIDAVMVLPPYFEGPDLEGVYYHFEAVNAAIDVPIMVYNIPQHSGIDITPDFFRRLLELSNVRYIKDSMGDLVRIQELVETGGAVFNGGDPIAFQGLLAGCQGCVWGAVNAMPKEAVQLYELVSSGQLVEANEVWRRLLPAQLFFWATPVYNPAVKAAANLQGFSVGIERKPQQPLASSELEKLKSALAVLNAAS